MGGLFLSRCLLVQANDTLRRENAKPRPANPSSIIVQVEGSGTPGPTVGPVTETSSTYHSSGSVRADIVMVSEPVMLPVNVKLEDTNPPVATPVKEEDWPPAATVKNAFGSVDR